MNSQFDLLMEWLSPRHAEAKKPRMFALKWAQLRIYFWTVLKKTVRIGTHRHCHFTIGS